MIVEARQTLDEACGPVNYDLPIPSVDEVLEIEHEDDDGLVWAFCKRLSDEDDEPPMDPIGLGERLLAHPLTRAVLAAVGDRARSLDDAVTEVITRAPEWGRVAQQDPGRVATALSCFISLLSRANRRVGDRDVPLLWVEVQLWIREVSRLLRAVDPEPSFRWADSPSAVALADSDEAPVIRPSVELPAVYCRRCGHAGWMGLGSELSNTLSTKHAGVYRASMDRSPLVRVLLRAQEADPAAVPFDAFARRAVMKHGDGTIPVHMTPDGQAAKRQICPSCGESDAIRFLGLAVASLASVSISTIFGSPHVDPAERKLLAFTDSVQDASHRASFFAGRSHRFNLRSLMSHALQGGGDDGLSLADLGDELMWEATSAHDRYGLVPPDLTRDPLVRSVWSDAPDPEALDVLRQRVGFEVDLEFGLRSRVGRTLEQSVAAAASVNWGDFDEVIGLAAEVVKDVSEDPPESTLTGLEHYLLGLGDRLRNRGALVHPLLEPYIKEGGRQWFIWGGRPTGLPPFTPGQGRPTFATSAGRSDFDSLTALSSSPTWFVDWGVRSLGLDPATARQVNERVVSTLAETTDVLCRIDSAGGNQVYGLDRRSVLAVDIPEEGGAVAPSVIRCDLCASSMVVPPAKLHLWIGCPCSRYRCPGHLQAHPPLGEGYYRRFYRHGHPRRVVAAEHTGLLGRRARETLETAFKAGTAPDAPNVLTATPTLELGIDIGDLSAVMLTSVPRNPASYIQRVGRAGRASGNALVTTFVRSDTHGLYYLAEPEAMLAGVVGPPNCYLEATETLNRQYVAYLIDRVADGSIEGPMLPNRMGELMKSGFEPDGMFRVLIDASIGQHDHAETFLGLFGEHLGERASGALRDYAGGGIEARIKEAADVWYEHRRELDLRRDRLNRSIEKLEAVDNRSEDDEEELRSLKGQRSAVIWLLREHRNEYPLSALERLGVLPNYMLVDDTVQLAATLWTRDGDDFQTEVIEYARPGRVAIREFAPGNSFYAGGHRHLVDALEIGAAQEPLYERWRLCPDCAYADIEPAGAAPTSCPRCSGGGIADTGARFWVLRLRTALSSGSEEGARVYDEDDERQREAYEVITLVDPDPTEVSGAWLLPDRTFGAELCTRTRLRTFNLGLTDRAGENRPIGGTDRHVSKFTVCRHCGAVKDARNDSDGARPERLHQGWCKVRSGAVGAEWDQLVLLHELTTEAIRFIVPVSMFEVDERLASFKAALLLGIKARLGGNPEHLTITTADSPNDAGQGRRRFLVLYDQIPGGTGYLSPLANPEQIHEILVAAREHIARCSCRNEGRPACHRCLLGVVDRWEYDLVRRDLAKELLDALLEDWDPAPVATVAGASIALVEESELERRFKVALREWAEHAPRVEYKRVPGKGRHQAFELSVAEGTDVARYRIDEQLGLSTSPNTLPDFLIKRMDASGPEIAVYLDGFEFHASANHNHIADDSRKREGVRMSGRLVWNLSWSDVELFHKAVSADPPHSPPERALLDGRAKGVAQQIQHAQGGAFDIKKMQANPMALLLEYLLHPNIADWERMVLSVAGGLGGQDGLHPVDRAGLSLVLGQSLRGGDFDVPTPAEEPIAHVSRCVTSGGLPLVTVLDAEDTNSERWTVIAVLRDGTTSVSDEAHRTRWADWLAWANLLQFLGGPHESRGAVITGSSQAASGDLDDLWLRYLAGEAESITGHAPAVDAALPGAPTSEQQEELELMADEVRELVAKVVEPTGPAMVAGHETADGLVVEAAWPDRRVGVLMPGDDVPAGWSARAWNDWTPEELRLALQEAS